MSQSATANAERELTVSAPEELGLVQGAQVLAVAPHPDDLALSCGGLLRRLGAIKVTLLTCFSRSTYAPFASIRSAAPDDVQEIRILEDEEYARTVGATPVDLGLDDVTVRYTDSSEWLCRNPEPDETFAKICELLRGILACASYTHVLCPLAVGNHVDHHFAREAVRLAVSSHTTLLYYEDLPYAIRIGGVVATRDFAGEVLSSGAHALINITPVIEMKLEDIGIYKSQIDSEDLQNVFSYAADLGGPTGFAERIWFESGFVNQPARAVNSVH